MQHLLNSHAPSAADFLDGKIDEKGTPIPTAATQAASPVAPAQAGVAVRRPDGTTTTIPAAHLQNAMKYGYKQIAQ